MLGKASFDVRNGGYEDRQVSIGWWRLLDSWSSES